MARKKIVFVIVEGPSDDTALGVLLNRIYDKNMVHIEIMHGDITSDLLVNHSNIIAYIGGIVEAYAEENHYDKVHFKEIIHLIDMDGAYIPDTNILEDSSAEKSVYSFAVLRIYLHCFFIFYMSYVNCMCDDFQIKRKNMEIITLFLYFLV